MPARSCLARKRLRMADWPHEYEDIVWIDDKGLRHIDYAKIDAIPGAASGRKG